jgi:hypothetical protein
MQHFLKPPSRTAWTEIGSSKLLEKLFVSVDDPMTALDLRF